MAEVGQYYYRVFDQSSGEYLSNVTDIYKNIISEPVYKLGVQAPPGSKMLINDKEILMGRTGIYELDEDIKVRSLSFIEQYEYAKDEDATKKALDDGKEQLAAAENYRKEEMAKITDADGSITDWNTYQTIQETYYEKYYAAMETYKKGVNGVYNPTNVPRELNNVIIDYVR